jgi:hypothetical protein
MATGGRELPPSVAWLVARAGRAVLAPLPSPRSAKASNCRPAGLVKLNLGEQVAT